jgi:hypothetical protein
MLSTLHEVMVEAFRNALNLAPDLLRDMPHAALPEYNEIRVESSNFAQTTATPYNADLVLVLLADGSAVFAIIIEVQLSNKKDKSYVWPLYAIALRARLRCPTCVLVVTPSAAVRQRASTPIQLGFGNTFTPVVIECSELPVVGADSEPSVSVELSLLSALGHCEGPRGAEVFEQLLFRLAGLDAEKKMLYCDVVLASVSDATQAVLEKLMMQNNYTFQSNLALRNQALGKAEGEARGKADAVLVILRARAIDVSDPERMRILACADVAKLDQWLVQALTAQSSELLA